LASHQVFLQKPSTWRQHHTSRGKVKFAYSTAEEAKAAAEEHSSRRSPTRYSDYRCGTCLWWHIGRSRKIAPISRGEFEGLALELGVRVAANIKDEILHPYGSVIARHGTAMKFAQRRAA
jgi:hypothetical protein